MDDLISRQAAIDAVKQPHGGCYTEEAKRFAVYQLLSVPTFEPDAGMCWGCNCPKMPTAEKKGRWVYDEERGATGIYAICTACNEMIYQTGEFNYCPNCGARMEQ